jgi:exosortase
MNDEDMGHGMFVIPVAVYVVWMRREKWLSIPLEFNWLGAVLVVLGACQLLVGTLGVEFFVSRTAFITTLTGLILAVGSWRLLREFLFPLALLLFMIPIPAILYNQITFPLQMFASRVAENALSLLGVPVIREGNILELPSQRLSVVEACSGIRSLLSLSFLSLAYGFFFEPRTWLRWVLFFITIPIAVVANAGRVTITGLLSEANPELAKGLFHIMEGWVIFVIALVILVACHQLIARLAGKPREVADAAI